MIFKPKERKSFIFYIGALIESDIFKTLDSLSNHQKKLNCEYMAMTLGKSGKDIWNNSIKYARYHDGGYIISSNDKPISPEFELHSTTLMGNIITSNFSRYNK
ncbi:hypothetical protein [Aquimarina sp. Aq78]|uniref:hypothetical protein n=1 Tax=Aquimarina sp. Aq78 TaxID=1191889 RepID=UPI000D5573A1|nr:hypothetical protein [Aquimarina sp. Aq78]